jgi:hypothetical protein
MHIHIPLRREICDQLSFSRTTLFNRVREKMKMVGWQADFWLRDPQEISLVDEKELVRT